ncbi:glycoside hydrolase family 127 protein [Leadbettera azotonutricia]|nr:beta-L-arabinofuranosidase domain-containing protein [Leadbettera azotonutricia]
MDNSQFTMPVSLGNVEISDKFWSPFMERVRTEVIPYQWQALNDKVEGAEPSFCIRNFKVAAMMTHPELDYGFDKAIGFGGMVFQDSDLAKWIEAAAYSLVWRPDPVLEKETDDTIDIICSAQQPDGYLDTYYIIKGLDKRFSNLKDNHELYCLGHFTEAAVAYFEATGKRKMMDAFIRYIDCVDRHIGKEEGKLHGYPGHEILELALVRLYDVTKDEKHLKLARYFIDQRGQSPLYFEEETKRNGNEFYWKDSYVKYQYYQAGKPVRDQHIAEGHAVRAVYLYSGMADIARLTGDDTLIKSCSDLWENITQKQMYITGGIGQSAYGEAFSYDYDLPNDTVYAETCASIGLAFFARRMLSIAPKGSFADVLETALYNGIISGMSLDGKSFFYVNPLEVIPEANEKDRIRRHVKGVRQKWFACACCPPNLARIISSLGSYIYSVKDNALYTHLFIGSTAKAQLSGKEVTVKLETSYPWEEKVRVDFQVPGEGAKFDYAFRLPGWCRSCSVELNGAKADYKKADGYAIISREWKSGDSLSIVFDMPVNFVEANPKVRENSGKLAITRGPVVYCLEEVDNGKELFKIHADLENGKPHNLKTAWEKDLLSGIVTLSFTGKKEKDWPSDALYRPVAPAALEDKLIKCIPYYAWTNRNPGEMTVWMNK